VQVADAAPCLGDRLAFHLQDQPQYAMSRRVLWAHVDHDALVATFGVL
jgi:hypothetical protein